MPEVYRRTPVCRNWGSPFRAQAANTFRQTQFIKVPSRGKSLKAELDKPLLMLFPQLWVQSDFAPRTNTSKPAIFMKLLLPSVSCASDILVSWQIMSRARTNQRSKDKLNWQRRLQIFNIARTKHATSVWLQLLPCKFELANSTHEWPHAMPGADIVCFINFRHLAAVVCRSLRGIVRWGSPQFATEPTTRGKKCKRLFWFSRLAWKTWTVCCKW